MTAEVAKTVVGAGFWQPRMESVVVVAGAGLRSSAGRSVAGVGSRRFVLTQLSPVGPNGVEPVAQVLAVVPQAAATVFE